MSTTMDFSNADLGLESSSDEEGKRRKCEAKKRPVLVEVPQEPLPFAADRVGGVDANRWLTKELGWLQWSFDWAIAQYPALLPPGQVVNRFCSACIDNGGTGVHEECSLCNKVVCLSCSGGSDELVVAITKQLPWCCQTCKLGVIEDAATDKILLHTLRTGYKTLEHFTSHLKGRPKWTLQGRAEAYMWDHSRAVLLHRREGAMGWLVVPTVEARCVLVEEAHMQGHIGMKQLAVEVNKTFWWTGLTTTLTQVVKSCDRCRRQRQTVEVVEELRPQDIPNNGWSVLCMDVVNMARTGAEECYLLICQDWISKWVEGISLKDKRPETVATVLRQNFVEREGCPHMIITEPGLELNKMLLEVLHLCGCSQNIDSPEDADGKPFMKRFKETVVEPMKAVVCRESVNSWERALGDFLIAYRGFPHASTQQSPYKLLRGTAIRLPWPFPALERMFLPDGDPEQLTEYMLRLGVILEEWYAVATEKTQAVSIRDMRGQTAVDAKYRFEVGDEVYVETLVELSSSI